LTDVAMPDMNGTRLLQELETRVPHVKVVAMTGYLTDITANALDAGFTDRLLKPFSIEELQRTVREALNQHSA